MSAFRMSAYLLPRESISLSLWASFRLFLRVSLSTLLVLVFAGCQAFLNRPSETGENRNTAIAAINVLNPQQQKVIEDLMTTAVDAVNFNGSVLLANSQSVLFKKSYGYVDASLKGDAGQPLTPDHAFSPGSVAKEFSTIALMHLKQAKKIDFDTPLSAYIKDLPVWAEKVTIEHLLTHTSGIPDVEYQRNMTTEQAIEDIRAIGQLEFAPGTDFLYGNNNTILRSLVVEKVTGMSFEDYLHQYIFAEFDMTQTEAKSDFTPANGKIAKGAIPLALKGVTAYTTTHDLYLWQKGLWSGKLVSQAAMYDAITLPSLGGAGRAKYDFGFYRQNAAGSVSLLEHDGTYPIHYTWSLYDIEHDLYVILLSNDGRKSSLNEIKRVLHKYLSTGKLTLPNTWTLIQNISELGVAEAINQLRTSIEAGNIAVNEAQLNTLGYDYFYANKPDVALAILKMTLTLFPTSLNALDSYVEVLIESGKKTEALSYIEKGLRLAHEQNDDFAVKRFMRFAQSVRQEQKEEI